jgi:hypothetical protein
VRKILTVVLVLLFCAGTASAQDNSKKLIKISVGIGAIVIGTAIAAKSSETVTTSGVTTSTSSTSQLVTGLVIAGAGGIVLWSGLHEHRASPTLTVGISPQGHAMFIRRSW